MPDDFAVRIGTFAAAVALALATAVVFGFVLRAPARPRSVALIVLSAACLLTPLLIPPAARFPRCIASIVAVTTVLRMYDLHLGAARGVLPRAAEMPGFLVNIFGLVHRRLDAAPRPPPGHEFRRISLAGAAVIAAAAAFAALFFVNWTRAGFASEHAAKVLAFFLVLVPFVRVLSSVWRLLGGRGIDFMDNPFAARTPADFWRRYNRPVHQFLQEDVFLPAGGRRHPVRGAILVFLVSAAVHEYVFSIPVGRVQGYQTAFFLLQGLAVAATMRLNPTGPAAAAGVVLTLVFNLATGVLFFASVNEVLPFYQNPMPLWRV